MKTALVITDGLRQIALTPDNEEEKQILEMLHKQQWNLSVRRGQFYICRGDYARFGTWSSESGCYAHDESTILVLEPETVGQSGRAET